MAMKILHITPTFQHPKVRGSHRYYYFIRELAQRHEITLLTLERSPIAPEARQEVTTYTKRLFTFPLNDASRFAVANLARNVPHIGPQVVRRLDLRAAIRQMKACFSKVVRQDSFDLILLHGRACFSVIENWQGLPTVADICDADSLRVRTKMEYANPALSLILRLQHLQVRRVEKKIAQYTPHLIFISERDRASVLGANGQAKVIPNGIDLAYWTRRSHNPQPNCLIFTGVMDYPPNEDAALYLIDHILPLVRPLVPGLQIIIAGRNPTLRLLNRAQLHPEVVVTGFVEDMRDYLEKAALFVAPLRIASGTQNKIQEALAMEVPVITTPIVADGLRITKGEEPPLYVVNGAAAFADQIRYLLNQPEERTRLAQAGRSFVSQHFVWRQSAAQLEEILQEAVVSERRRRG